jgi:hypothetical protein
VVDYQMEQFVTLAQQVSASHVFSAFSLFPASSSITLNQQQPLRA